MVVAGAILCAATTGLQSQARSDTTGGGLAQSGARDGARAAKSISIRKDFAGGLASSMIGPWGLFIVVPVANRHTIVPANLRSAMVDTNRVYVDAFANAFADRVRQRRRTAAITGNLIIWIPISILLLSTVDL